MEYTDEGDTPPHDENPSWDPSGLILKAHFQAAEANLGALLLAAASTRSTSTGTTISPDWA